MSAALAGPVPEPGGAAELVDAVRAGRASAYGRLYLLHRDAAYRQARQLARNPADVDDLVAAAFARVLEVLRTGRGPTEDRGFRAYLLTAVRHTAYDKTRRDRRVELVDDVDQAVPEVLAVPFRDTAIAHLDSSWVAAAFAALPQRWRLVLWHTVVEGRSPAEVAPLLGLAPNGVSALAYRAREGLRQAFLQQHLADAAEDGCRASAARLGAWVRGGLGARQRAAVNRHLAECGRCRALAAELVDVAGGLARTAA